MVDRFGIWLSSVAFRRAIGTFDGRTLVDIGCGFQAAFTRPHLPRVSHAILVDLALAEDLKQDPKVRAIEGVLPEVLEGVESGVADIVLCNNVLEHLWKPEDAVAHIRRILRPGSVAFLNVPSWYGKTALETAAFRLGLAPKDEMDDHKAYYTRREFWALLVRGGWKPSELTVRTHKFGLNTFAVCRKAG